MLVLDSIILEKWYTVQQTSDILGWSHDMVDRWIERGLLQAFVIESRSDKRPRIYRGKRIQGAEIIRFVKEHLTVLRPGKPRFRIA